MTDYRSVIAHETGRFIEAVRAADPTAAVPTCPDWAVDDLLWHLTEVHAFWAGVLRDGAQTDEAAERVEAAKPERPSTRPETFQLLIDETAALLAELDAHGDAEPAWFWLETDRTVGATRRMQAHEATMHRIDAELAAGRVPGEVDPQLAFDGLSHVATVMWAWWATIAGFAFAPVGGIVELAAEDLGLSVALQPGRWQGVGESSKEYDVPSAVLAVGSESEPEARVSATAAELYRWLWGRGDEPPVSGDQVALNALRAARDQGMQ